MHVDFSERPTPTIARLVDTERASERAVSFRSCSSYLARTGKLRLLPAWPAPPATSRVLARGPRWRRRQCQHARAHSTHVFRGPPVRPSSSSSSFLVVPSSLAIRHVRALAECVHLCRLLTSVERSTFFLCSSLVSQMKKYSLFYFVFGPRAPLGHRKCLSTSSPFFHPALSPPPRRHCHCRRCPFPFSS